MGWKNSKHKRHGGHPQQRGPGGDPDERGRPNPEKCGATTRNTDRKNGKEAGRPCQLPAPLVRVQVLPALQLARSSRTRTIASARPSFPRSASDAETSPRWPNNLSRFSSRAAFISRSIRPWWTGCPGCRPPWW
jgi:hypothetical protein